jgi:argininosuccinate lyase
MVSEHSGERPHSDALGVGHRLSTDPSDLLASTAFAHELDAAPILWHGMAMADLAHAIALDEAGLLPDAARRPLFDSLLASDEIELHEISLDPRIGDIYNNRDRLLRELAGPHAGYIHTGRARREASTIGWQLACRERMLGLGAATAALLDVLASVSWAHRGSLMADLTYLHRAQPTTLGHYLLGHAAPIARHLVRIDRARASVDSSPAGSGSTNGSRLPIDRALLTELLGFESTMRHTRDAMWAPDIALDLTNVALQVMVSIDRLAEELQLFTTEAFGFAELDDTQSRTSVVMPHKKNPYSLTWLRGTARRSLGTSAGITATMLTASGQPDNRTFAYLDVPTLITETTRAVELLTAVMSGITFDTDALRAAASTGFTTSTEICDHLSLHSDLDNRTSHQIVGSAVRLAIEDGRTDLERDDLRRAADSVGVQLDIDDTTFALLTDPDEAVASRVTPGGASALEIEAMVAEHRESAAAWARQFEEHPSIGYDVRLVARARRQRNKERPST